MNSTKLKQEKLLELQALTAEHDRLEDKMNKLQSEIDQIELDTYKGKYVRFISYADCYTYLKVLDAKVDGTIVRLSGPSFTTGTSRDATYRFNLSDFIGYNLVRFQSVVEIISQEEFNESLSSALSYVTSKFKNL